MPGSTGSVVVQALPPVATSADQTFWSAANDASYAGRLGIKSLVNVNNSAEWLGESDCIVFCHFTHGEKQDEATEI